MSLSEQGTVDFPEIDHIIPKSKGGSNWYSNARVVSWKLNNSVDRVKDVSDYMDIARLSYLALPSTGPMSDKLVPVVEYILQVASEPLALHEVRRQIQMNYHAVDLFLSVIDYCTEECL